MAENSNIRFLDILIGEKVSSVTFVMNYLQIDFEGNRFTFNIWPMITVDNIDFKFGDTLYRDKLCSLIFKIVSGIELIDNEKLIIAFDESNRIYLSLDPNNPEISGPEIAYFSDINKNFYVFQ